MAEGDRALFTRKEVVRGDMIEMFKIMKGTDKISTDELFNRIDSDRTRCRSLRVKMVVRQGGDFHSESS